MGVRGLDGVDLAYADLCAGLTAAGVSFDQPQ